MSGPQQNLMLKFFTSHDEKFLKSGNTGNRSSSVGANVASVTGLAAKKLKISSKLVELEIEDQENQMDLANGLFHIKGKKSQESHKSRDRYSSNKKRDVGHVKNFNGKMTPYKEYKDSSTSN